MVIGTCYYRLCNKPAKNRYCEEHEGDEFSGDGRGESFLNKFLDRFIG